MPPFTVKVHLDAWRYAEHQRESCEPGSPEWVIADEEVQNAIKLFHAEFAQTYARYSEERIADRYAWTTTWLLHPSSKR